jgi:hypothetical protein
MPAHFQAPQRPHFDDAGLIIEHVEDTTTVHDLPPAAALSALLSGGAVGRGAAGELENAQGRAGQEGSGLGQASRTGAVDSNATNQAQQPAGDSDHGSSDRLGAGRLTAGATATTPTLGIHELLAGMGSLQVSCPTGSRPSIMLHETDRWGKGMRFANYITC